MRQLDNMNTRSLHTRMTSDRPFSPRTFPFFYGWIILGAGSLGMLMSIPGQTVGVSVFTDHLIQALGLSRNTISIAYLLGTIGSAFMLAAAGRSYDRYGARVLSITVSILLGCTLIYLAAVDSFASFIILLLRIDSSALMTGVSFSAITFGFFAIRFLGQGTLTMASRNMVMKWFEKRRGMVNAVLGITISLGFSAAPRFLDLLIGNCGWRGAWRLIALGLFIFSVLAYLFYRDNPQSSGLKPDGAFSGKPHRLQHRETIAGKDFSLVEARRTFSFWFFNLMLALSALLVTAFTFHVISIFEESGLTRSMAVNIFLPASIIAVSTQFAGSWISDYIQLKYIGLVQLFGIIVQSLGILLLSPDSGYLLLIFGLGITQGMMGITSNITWPRFYGIKHLGAVSGYAMAWTVAGSAVGPYVFSLSLDLLGSYAFGAFVCVFFGVIGFFAAFFVKKPA